MTPEQLKRLDDWQRMPHKLPTTWEDERMEQDSCIRANYFRAKAAFDSARIAYEIRFGKDNISPMRP